MQDNGNPSPSIAEEEAATDHAIMELLLEDRGLFEVGEISTVLGGPVSTATDAVARLKQGGLIHECSGFVFASRSAVVSAAIWGYGN